MLKDPAARKRLDDNHLDPLAMSPEAFARFVAADHARWQRIIETSGVAPQ
jgi:tripartite-type tricarboxylate transporter receptor subunit TctC